jgi:hypothetical protein
LGWVCSRCWVLLAFWCGRCVRVMTWGDNPSFLFTLFLWVFWISRESGSRFIITYEWYRKKLFDSCVIHGALLNIVDVNYPRPFIQKTNNLIWDYQFLLMHAYRYPTELGCRILHPYSPSVSETCEIISQISLDENLFRQLE